MDKNWKVGRLKDHLGLVLMFVLATAYLKLNPCCCMNEEGLALLRFRDRIESDPFGALTNWHEDEGELDPCSWRGVECSDGKVVILDLKDLCLGGTLAPEIGYLVHIKAIILRNNTFSGTIPEQLSELKELEVLDLGYNNFIGPLPDKLGINYSSAILLLENNPLLSASYPEIHEFEIMSRSQVDEISATGLSCTTRSTSQKEDSTEDTLQRRFLASEPPSYLRSQNANRQPPLGPSAPVPSPGPAINIPKVAFAPTPAPVPPTEPSHFTPVAEPSPSTTVAQQPKSSKSNLGLGLGLGIGGFTVFFLLIVGIYCYRRHKVITVKPWATGLSGQLQKAFVTGVPKLKRSELETACEDFSNVIGSSSIGTIYKGTLSSGVEIAVASIASKSAEDWSTNLESQFRKKIRTLSKVNHKNFVNLIGYCEEEVPLPFTRMMVFEYAPNGTLFEHLHIEESEHLDWGMRLRIAMGMAYCLEHMHQLDPAIPHKNLNSSAITLTEDYAAKVSEFSFWNQISAAETETKAGIEVIETSHKVAPQHNVYSFGVLLFEMVTARLPFTVDNGSSLENWASDYVREERPLRQIVDPTLTSFDANQVDEIEGVIRSCVEPNPIQRPKMRDVCERLRGITGIPNDLAAPRISPLWWAELEILSTEAN